MRGWLAFLFMLIQLTVYNIVTYNTLLSIHSIFVCIFSIRFEIKGALIERVGEGRDTRAILAFRWWDIEILLRACGGIYETRKRRMPIPASENLLVCLRLYRNIFWLFVRWKYNIWHLYGSAFFSLNELEVPIWNTLRLQICFLVKVIIEKNGINCFSRSVCILPEVSEANQPFRTPIFLSILTHIEHCNLSQIYIISIKDEWAGNKVFI